MNINIDIFGKLSVIAILFSLAIAGLYFVFFGFIRHLFQKTLIYYKILLGFIFALISALTTFIVNLYATTNYESFLAWMLAIFVFWITLNYISFYTGMIVLVFNVALAFILPPNLPQYFIDLSNGYEIVLWTIAYAVMLAFYIAGKFFPIIDNWTKWLMSGAVIFGLSILFQFTNYINKSEYSGFVVMLFWMITSYLIYFIITSGESSYWHAIKLRNILDYDYNYYVIDGKAVEYLGSYCTKQKVKYGFFINFHLENYAILEQVLDNNILNNILWSVTSQVYNLFKTHNKETLFFKSAYWSFGIFVPLTELNAKNLAFSYQNNDKPKRLHNDPLFKIFDLFNKVNTKFEIQENILNLNLKSSVSIFGHTSNDLNYLSQLGLTFAQQNIYSKYKNDSILIDTNLVKKLTEQNRKMTVLNNVININQNAFFYSQIYNLDQKQVVGQIITPVIDGIAIESQQFTKYKEKIYDYGLDVFFYRYIGYQALISMRQNYKNNADILFFIPYIHKVFENNDFVAEEFEAKFRSLGIHSKNIVLMLDCSQNIDNIEIFTKNLDKIRKYNFKICIQNFGVADTKYRYFEYYKPDYLIMNKEILELSKVHRLESEKVIKELLQIANKVNAQLIATFVDGYFTYKWVTNLGVKLISGGIFGINPVPHPVLNSEVQYLLNKK